MISVITCTGNRPEALALCASYLAKQTIAKKVPIQWIVIDDSPDAQNEPPQNIPDTQIHAECLKGPRTWEPGVNTHRWNMELALSRVKGDQIVIFEDDDLYKPTYLEAMLTMLQHVDIVGETNVKYFHLDMPGYKELRNYTHSSLASTALNKSVLPLLYSAVNSGELFFDLVLWRKAHQANIPLLLYSNLNLCIGMKGMPGRANIGIGADKRGYIFDKNLAKLREWVGASTANNYLPFIRKHERSTETKHPVNVPASGGGKAAPVQRNAGKSPGGIGKPVFSSKHPVSRSAPVARAGEQAAAGTVQRAAEPSVGTKAK